MCDIGGMRKNYRNGNESFGVQDLVSNDPFEQFHAWFKEASTHPGIEEANAMALATASKDGMPSVRMLLMKGYGRDMSKIYGSEFPVGFVFFTNYGSRKAREIAENPRASLAFYWEPLKRSVRIEGDVVKISEQASSMYFKSRPLSSQIGACVSEQSQVVKNRMVLLDKEEELRKVYSEDNAEDLKKPENWGGYCVVPRSFEFWQGQTNRIHDRIRFRQDFSGEVENGKIVPAKYRWLIERLAP